MQISFRKEIESMRLKFQQGGRKIPALPRPDWMTADETMSRVYDELPALARTGRIQYAHFVQANVILFKSLPRDDCPAAVIFSTDGYYDENPDKLNGMASMLYAYKGEGGAPENMKAITDAITDEYERLYNVRLPKDADNIFDVFYTTIMVYRKHLPGRKLIGLVVPVITEPNTLQSTLILPKQYWTRAFADFYLNG
ncbi:MAG: hypothetical protein FWG03_04765 [Clostridiales bacterium]|nr:hypothetical protein [Clostridiales bacterium]